MGIGIAFTYLVIAALAAPLLWLLWWGAGSLVGGRLQVSAVPTRGNGAKNAVKVRSGFDYPRPADVTLPGRRGAVAIYRLTDATEIGTCHGPDHAGKCPRALADGTVPCAGSLLALPRPIRGSAEWHIPFGYRACLLGSYDVFRQAGPAN